MRNFRRMAVATLLLTSLMTSGCWFFTDQVQHSAKENSGEGVSYSLLDDDMGTIIKIGVVPTISEKELRATLVKAADEHQDDPARDYLGSMFLRVEAYLVKDGKQSTAKAGTLVRYVPPGNPAERKKLTIDRTKDDKFTISIDEATKNLY